MSRTRRGGKSRWIGAPGCETSVTMANPIESLSNALADRIRSPFLGTYGVTALVYHWPAWAYFFESTPAAVKATRLAPLLGTPSAFLAPAAIALVIVVAGPFLNWGIASVVTWPKRRQLKIDAGLEGDQLRGLKAQLRAERGATEDALSSLHEQQRDWEAGEAGRTLRKNSGEEELTRLTKEIEGLRVIAEKGQNEIDTVTEQLEQLKIARSDALGQRDILLSQAKGLRKRIAGVQGIMAHLLAAGPEDPLLAQGLWVQVKDTFPELRQAGAEADADVPP